MKVGSKKQNDIYPIKEEIVHIRILSITDGSSNPKVASIKSYY
jgi:hypothetical protein